MSDPRNSKSPSTPAISVVVENDESNNGSKPKINLPSLEGLENEPSNWTGTVVRDDNEDPLTEDMRKARVQKAVKEIHELYKAGVPFFSKTAIQDIVDQIDRMNDLVRRAGRSATVERQRFIVRGLDGGEIQFQMETGMTEEVRDGSQELIKMDPRLQYESYQHLTTRACTCSIKLVYCPLRIMYRTYLRDSDREAAFPLENLQSWARRNGDPPTEETVRQQFDACLAYWEEEYSLRRNLTVAIETIPLPAVTKIVAFACATISDEDNKDARIQHAILVSLRKILESRPRQDRNLQQTSHSNDAASSASGTTTGEATIPPTASSIQCFAQDPAYTVVDKTILAEHGVTVLDDPRGFLQVDDQSAVLSFAPNICVRQIVADIARPALLIWNTVHSEEESMKRWKTSFGDSEQFESLHQLEGNLTDPESPRLRDMIRDEYTMVMQIAHGVVGSDVSIYVRKR